MNLELYRAFYYTARAGSITKASEELYISQPAVSKAVHKLENDLNCSLFFRTSKGVKLTNEGHILFQYIDKAYNFVITGERKILENQELISGDIRIGVSDSICKYYLIPYLKLFNTYYPSINIHVVCPTTPKIINLIKNGKVDFGIINMPIYDSQLEYKYLMKIQDCFITGEKYKKLSFKMQHITDISKYPILLLDKSCNTRNYINKYFKNNSISIIPAFELGNMDLLIQFAKYDFGIACVIKNFIKDDLDKKELYEVNLIEKINPRNISAVWLKNIPLSIASKQLLNYLDNDEISEI